MKMSINRHCTIVIAAVLAGVTTDAWAQDEGQDEESRRQGIIEEIIVTAQKREESQQDVPFAITTFTGMELAKRQAVTLEALQGAVPNVQIGHFNNTPRSAVFHIRGMGIIESNIYGGMTVQVVVDGVPQMFSMLALLNLYDLERIEVNRGPQGTLYGANTTGGVINVVNRQPTGEYGGDARLTLGNWHRIDADAALNFPISENLAGKVTVMHHSRDGWITDVVNNTDMESSNISAVRGYLKWTPSESFDATLIGELSRARDGSNASANGAVEGEPLLYRPPGSSPGPGLGIMYQGPCQPNQRCEAPDHYLSANSSGPDMSDLDVYAATLTMNWNTSFGQVTSITGFKSFDLHEFIDADGSPFFLLDTDRPTDGWQFSQELRSTFKPRDNVELIVGAFGHYQTYHHEGNVRFQFALPGLRQNQIEDQDKWTVSVFAHSFIDLTSKLRLQIGGRFSHEDTEMTDTSDVFLNFEGDSVYSGDTLLSRFVVSESGTWDEWAAKIGLDYRLSEEILAYGFFARGFKSGGFVGRIALPEDIGPYDPEYVKTLEGGIKSDWLDGRLRVNVAGFYNKYDDMQLPVLYFFFDEVLGANVHSTSIVNAANAETYGFELEVTAIPVAGLTLNGSLGYLYAEYSDFPYINPGTFTQTNLKGFRLQNAPKWTGTFGGRYEFPLGSGMATIGATYQYVGSKFNTHLENTPRSEVQPTHYINANLEWTPDNGRWSVDFWVLNLADNRYIASIFDAGPGLFGLVSYLPPRQYGVSFNYDW